MQRLRDGRVEAVPTRELFAGRKAVLFAVPGAFTTTCSDDHLPGFVARADELRAQGVELVACVASNDAFVVHAWSQAHGAGEAVTMLADGNGELARALGLDLDVSRFGLGTRSRRYAMVLDDGVVQELRVEPAGAVTVSGADAILDLL